MNEGHSSGASKAGQLVLERNAGALTMEKASMMRNNIGSVLHGKLTQCYLAFQLLLSQKKFASQDTQGIRYHWKRESGGSSTDVCNDDC